MAEFIKHKPIAVSQGNSIPLGEKIKSFRIFKIDCIWIEKDTELEKTWMQEASDIIEAYNIWREQNWLRLFDPLRVRIKSFNISAYR